MGAYIRPQQLKSDAGQNGVEPARNTILLMGVIIKNPDILGGTPVFRGTRVPVQTLFDYLEGGDPLEDFLEGFPTVSRELAVAALEEANSF